MIFVKVQKFGVSNTKLLGGSFLGTACSLRPELAFIKNLKTTKKFQAI